MIVDNQSKWMRTVLLVEKASRDFPCLWRIFHHVLRQIGDEEYYVDLDGCSRLFLEVT